MKLPDFEDIRSALLRDIKNLLPDADTGIDSDFFVRASSVAAIAENLYYHQKWIIKQIFPDTADTEFLEHHAALRGLRRKAATFATGIAIITGTAGASVAQNSIIQLNDKLRVTVFETVSIDSSGQCETKVTALDAGAVRQVENEAGKFLITPLGVDSIATVTLAGGTDEETDAELLARLLELIRRPPAGGNRYDYKRWALEVDGVTGAYVYPLRRGLGTVDVVITSNNTLASKETLQAVKNYIDEVRPVTAKNILILNPTPKPINFKIKVLIKNADIAVVKNNVRQTIVDFFTEIEPAQPLLLSVLETKLSLLDGVHDRKIIIPTDNITPVIDDSVVEWLTLGEVEIVA